MEWIIDVLKTTGIELTNEQIEQILSSIPKEGIEDDAVSEEITALKTRIVELEALNGQLEAGLDDAGSFDANMQLAELQKAYEQQILALTQDFEKQHINDAVEIALTKRKAKNNNAVKALMDFNKIMIGEDGNVTGIDRQIESIRQSDGYLFDTKSVIGSKGNFLRGQALSTPVGLEEAISQYYSGRTR